MTQKTVIQPRILLGTCGFCGMLNPCAAERFFRGDRCQYCGTEIVDRDAPANRDASKVAVQKRQSRERARARKRNRRK